MPSFENAVSAGRAEVAGELYQIGVVVRDLDEGIASYARLLGCGPFLRMETSYRARYREWEGMIANRNAFARWGQLYLEMVEPGTGQGNAREWLDQRGPGIFHLGYCTTDMGQRPGGLDPCFEVLSTRRADGGPIVLHFDLVDQLGYFVELSPSEMVRPLIAAIDAC